MEPLNLSSLVPVLNQMTSIHIVTYYYCRIHFNLYRTIYAEIPQVFSFL
jgi:hypothetical protein